MFASRHSSERYDPQRAFLHNEPLYRPLQVNPANTLSLQQALARGLIHANEPLLVFLLDETPFCLSLVRMIYHHVAEGVLNGTAWMMSYCVICNAGMVFSPQVEGKQHHFVDGGLYNAMTILLDQESQSLWNHITGYCLHGTHQGKQLKALTTPLQRSASQVLAEYPDIQTAWQALSPEDTRMIQEEEAARLDSNMALPAYLLLGMENLDERLPRFEMGLGVWTKQTQRYYTLKDLLTNHFILDELDGRSLVIYSSAQQVAPEAFFTTSRQLDWHGDALYLDDGQVLRDGILYDAQGKRLNMERPYQLFQRWYSFVILFPKCQIYGR